MSLGYADRLSFREDLGGTLGTRELLDSPDEVVKRVEELAGWIRESKKIVAFTGAGISTACGIPDFRGPNGVWTCQRAGKPPPKLHTSFTYAKPSLTHQALLALMQAGKLHYICSQNVDGLHLRSGVPRAQLAELHGNCFAERCSRCATEYVRDFEMESVGFKPTGRSCSQPGCGAPLKDQILDWEDALPDDELDASEAHTDEADVALCLGTSLQITPACDIPLRAPKRGGRMVIVNLQRTPKDRRAQLVLHSRVDCVMALLLERLGLALPAYERHDRLAVSHRLLHGAGCAAGEGAAGGGHSSAGSWGISLSICSPHGKECPLPMVQAVVLQLLPPEGDAALPAELAAPVQCSGAGPYSHTWHGLAGGLQQVVVQLQLQLVEHADEHLQQQTISYMVRRHNAAAAGPSQDAVGGTAGAGASAASAASPAADGKQLLCFTTQRVDYSRMQQELVAELRRQAAAAEASKGTAGTGKRKRQASGQQGEQPAATGVQTRPHTTRTGRQTRVVVDLE